MPKVQFRQTQLVFDHNGNKIIYNYKGDNTGKFSSIHYPVGALNNDFNFNTKTIAYTIDNNLYLATRKIL